MKRAKSICLVFLLVGSMLAGNCDINTKNDSKEKQNLMLFLTNGGGGGGSCTGDDACAKVTIDGAARTAYEDGGVPLVAASYNVGGNVTTITMCFDVACSEEILIYFPGQTTGTFNANSAAGNRVIIYAAGFPFNSDDGVSGSGTIEITGYDGSFVRGRFSGTVADFPVGTPGRITHSLTNGSFIAPF
jgi:hypothetical protein